MSFNEAVSKWESEKLSLLTDYISRGITPKYTEDNNRSILVVNQRCIREGKVLFEDARRHDIEKKKVTEEKFLRDFDVLVNSTGVGTLGRVSQIKKVYEPTTVDSHVTIVRGNANCIDKKYLGYAIKAQQSIIENMAEGSTGQTELSRKRLGDEIVISFPKSKQEQKAIAHILSTLDEKIEVNNQINKTLENIAQAIFKQWFVDFEFPNEDGEPYQSSGGEMVESELGMIPKGWEVGILKDISKFRNGKKIGQDLRSDYGVNKIYGSNGVIGNSNEFNENNSCIVIGRVGAYCGSIQLVLKPCWVTDNAIISLPLINKNLSYLYYLLLHASLRSRAGGSAQPLINQNILNNIKIIKPNVELLSTFYDIDNDLKKMMELNNDENSNLAEIRDSLLPKLMSGEIRVPMDTEGEAS